MNEFINSVLGLIFALGLATIIATFLIALFAPEQLPLIVKLTKEIVTILARKVPDKANGKRKRDDDDQVSR